MPRIVKYMTMMLMLATIVFFETLILKIAAQPNRKLPEWLQSLANFIDDSRIFKYIIASPFDEEAKPVLETIKASSEQPSDTFTVITNDQPSTQSQLAEVAVKIDWTKFCRLVDRIFFVALSLSFAIYNGY